MINLNKVEKRAKERALATKGEEKCAWLGVLGTLVALDVVIERQMTIFGEPGLDDDFDNLVDQIEHRMKEAEAFSD